MEVCAIYSISLEDCIFVYMYLCIYELIYVFMYLCIYVFMYLCISPHITTTTTTTTILESSGCILEFRLCHTNLVCARLSGEMQQQEQEMEPYARLIYSKALVCTLTHYDLCFDC